MKRLLSCISLFFFTQAQIQGLFRFPTVSKEAIVFTYAGNLYWVERQGGIARQLTQHDGYEMFPRFSPDGKHIAFTGYYDGNAEVYLMPATGGEPKRLTFTPWVSRASVSDRMGPNNIVITWTPNSKKVIFRSRMHSFNPFKGKLYAVDIETKILEQLPFSVAGFCSFAPDSSALAMNWVFREFRTWKGYRGGMADDIHIFDFQTKTFTTITHDSAQDIIPMWYQNTIYFLSDRTGRMNLFAYDLNKKTLRQITFFTDYDIKFPSLGADAIVFEKGGKIYLLELPSETLKEVPILLYNDHLLARIRYVDATKYIESAALHKDYLYFIARGDIVRIAKENTNGFLRITTTSDAHERNLTLSPDGKFLAFIADYEGEEGIYILATDKLQAQPTEVVPPGPPYKYALRWSPDSRYLLWSDRSQKLYVTEVKNKKTFVIDSSKYGEFYFYRWAPDSQHLIYIKRNPKEGFPRLFLYDLKTKKRLALTQGWYRVTESAFSPDGKYLFFVSHRTFQPIYSWTEWNHAYIDMAHIYLVPTKPQYGNPLLPFPLKDTTKNIPLQWETTSIESNAIQLTKENGSYWRLYPTKEGIYTLYSRRGQPTQLLYIPLKPDSEPVVIAKEVSNYYVFEDVMVIKRSNGDYYWFQPLPTAAVKWKDKINLQPLKHFRIEPRKEWQQIFMECWRQMRDFFYAPNLHGKDWEQIRRKYEVLLPYVNHRADLTYLIGEMIAELNAGHAYVGGGDEPKITPIYVGVLGADIEKAENGFFKITRILPGANWDASLRSPLSEPHVQAKEGEYIVAIDGIPTNQVGQLYELTVGKAQQWVTIALNDKPTLEDAREVKVKLLKSEKNLRYYAWIQQNIERVQQWSQGKVGYVHIPNMVTEGLNWFVRLFYPQLRKEALIIDVRGNGGGNVSPMIIERLRRTWVLAGIARNGMPYPSPWHIHLGPKVCLLDRYSASDGDLFPYRFKKHGLGLLIGERSWGGVIGIRGTLPLVDGGYLNKPEFAHYDESGWVIEGIGVQPDITIINDPYKEYLGEDAQLKKAVEVLLETLEKNPQRYQLPPLPPWPKK